MRMIVLMAALTILTLGEPAAAQAVKDVNVVNNPTVAVSNLPATQSVEGVVDIRQSAARQLVVLSEQCTIPSGSTSCSVTFPPAPSGSIYIVNRIWNSNFVYSNAANVGIRFETPAGGGRWTESMKPFISFGIPGRFHFDSEKTLFASSLTINTVFNTSFDIELTVPYLVQAEVVAVQ